MDAIVCTLFARTMTSQNQTNLETSQPEQELSGESQSKEPTTATIENDQKDDDSAKSAKKRKRLQKLVRILLFLPYILGIIWTCLHPIVSVITGELKCRGWYLDEHSIETRFTVGEKPELVPSHLKDLAFTPLRSRHNQIGYSLCDYFSQKGDPDFNGNNLICHRHGDHFEVAMIMPLSNAIDASEEAVVLVLPTPSDVYLNRGEVLDWNSSIFHKAVVKSIQHLANPVETPWLAKAVLVVTPTMSNDSETKDSSLEETISLFLDAYSGKQTISQDYKRNQRGHGEKIIPPLPPKLSGAILRNLVVLEVSDNSIAQKSGELYKPTSTNLSILPHGRRGVLPNADLVFLVGKLMEQTLFHTHANSKTFLTHAYTEDSIAAEAWANQLISKSGFFSGNKDLNRKVRKWAKGMIDVLLFAKTMAVGPFPPHAPALERGIDSLTIRASFDGTYRRNPSVELVQHSEYIIRSLANLHERLHHSFTLYLLPSPMTFVSHIEYLLPNILVLLPLAVRVFGILLPKMKRGMDLTALGGILLVVLVMEFSMLLATDVFGFEDSCSAMMALYAFLYIAVSSFWVKKVLLRDHKRKPIDHDETKDDTNPETTRTILTLQFVTCALTVYILIPIAFSHVSLSYLPSVLWTPLLAFPDYPSMKWSAKKRFVLPVLFTIAVASAPPVALVPWIISTYTPFVRYAYSLIHVLFVLLVTSALVA